MEICKNNQTFSNDGSCSCRKTNDFLRKGEYCQSSKSMLEGGLAMKGRCPPPLFHPASCVYMREAGWIQPSPLCWCNWEHQEVSPAFSFAKMGPDTALARCIWGLPLFCLLLHHWTEGYPQAAEKPWKEPKPCREAGAEEQGFPADFPLSPQTEIIHKEPSDFIHSPTHEAFFRNPVLIKKYKELALLSAKEILYYCQRPDNWSHLECTLDFK